MIQIAFALSFILPNFVHSDENRPADVYAEFQIEIEAQLKRAVDNVSFNRDSFAINTFRLLSLSREIFRRYSHAYPECKSQYLAVIDDREEQLKTFTFDEVDARYHDGKNLPQAPKEAKCYFGRTFFAHSLMAFKHLPEKDADITKEVLGSVRAELEELLEHLPRTQSRIAERLGEDFKF